MTESSEFDDISEGPCDDILSTLVSRPRYDGISEETQNRIEQKYDIGGKLGRGAFGIVYAATTNKSNKPLRHVAIKIALPGSEEFLRDEVEVLEGRDLPSEISVSCHEHCIYDDEVQPYFVMQHLTGRPVGDYADDLLDLDQKLHLVQKLFRDLSSFHDSANVVLSDIKPAHILVERDCVTKFLDFGACKDNRRSRGLSQASKNVCTTGYAVPSISAGKSTNRLTDIACMAGVAFRVLTGQRPRFGSPEDEAETAYAASGVPELITGILIKAMRDPHSQKKQPRFASAKDVARDLADAIQTHVLNCALEPIVSEHEAELQKSTLDHDLALRRTIAKWRTRAIGLTFVCGTLALVPWYWLQRQESRIATDVRAQLNAELDVELARHHGTVSGLLLAESQHATIHWRLDNEYINEQHTKLVSLSSAVTKSREKGDLKSAFRSLSDALESSLNLVTENDRADTIASDLDRLDSAKSDLPVSLLDRLKSSKLRELETIVTGTETARNLWNQKNWQSAEKKIDETTELFVGLVESVANEQEAHLIEALKQAQSKALEPRVRRLTLEVAGLDGRIDKLVVQHAEEDAQKEREAGEVLAQLENAKTKIEDLSHERDRPSGEHSVPTWDYVAGFGLFTGMVLVFAVIVRSRRYGSQQSVVVQTDTVECPVQESEKDQPTDIGQSGQDKWCSYCQSKVPEDGWGNHNVECSGRSPCRFCGKPIPKSRKGVEKHERVECKMRPELFDDLAKANATEDQNHLYS